jgi:hypothetical protein
MVQGCINNTITQEQCDFSRIAFPQNHSTFATALAEGLADMDPSVTISPAKYSVLKKVLGQSVDVTLSGAFVSVTQGAHAQPQETPASGGNFNALRGQPGRAILPSQGPLQSGPGDILT